MNASEQEIYDDLCVFHTRKINTLRFACRVTSTMRVFLPQISHIGTHTWSTLTATGHVPTARNAHAALLLPRDDASDASSYRMLLFGGSSPETGPFADVFVLHITVADDQDGGAHEASSLEARWELMACTGEAPEARELHAACFLVADDPNTPSMSSSKVVCFCGGRNVHGTVCTDMALLDLTTWAWQLVPICEWNRCAHVAATIGASSSIVSFGGWDGAMGILDDCWVYSHAAETWFKSDGGDKDTVEEEEDEPAHTSDDTKVATICAMKVWRGGILT